MAETAAHGAEKFVEENKEQLGEGQSATPTELVMAAYAEAITKKRSPKRLKI